MYEYEADVFVDESEAFEFALIVCRFWHSFAIGTQQEMPLQLHIVPEHVTHIARLVEGRAAVTVLQILFIYCFQISLQAFGSRRSGCPRGCHQFGIHCDAEFCSLQQVEYLLAGNERVPSE